jgi:hypothetical protein
MDRHVQPKANPILRGDKQRKGGSRVGGVGSWADGSRGGKGDNVAISFPGGLAIRQRGGYFRVLVTMTGRAMDRKTSGKALPDPHANQQPQVQFSLGGGRGGEKRTDQSERGKQLDGGGRGTRSGWPWYRESRLVTVPRFTSTIYVNECRVEMDSGIASNVIAPEAVRRGVGPVVWWIGEPVHFLR